MQFKTLLTLPLFLTLPLCVIAQSASLSERTADGTPLIEIRCKAPVLEEWMKNSPLVLFKEAGQWHQLWQEDPKLSSPLASAYQGLDKAALSTRICNERETLAAAKNMNEKGDCAAPGTIWRGFLHRQCAYRSNPLVKRMLDKCDINHDGLINNSGVDQPIEIWEIIEKEQVCQRAFLVDQLSLEIPDIKTRCDLNGDGRIDQKLSLIAPLMRSGKETNVRQAWKNFPEEIRNQVEAEEKCYENAGNIKNIFDAVRLGDLTAVRSFAKTKSNLESINKNGETPLIYAVDNVNPNEDVVKLLLNAGANVDAGVSGKKNNGLTALMYSAYHGNLNIMRWLISAKASTNARSEIGNTALMLAVQREKYEAIEILAKSAAKVDLADKQGVTPLMYASGKGDAKTIQILISFGANVNAQDRFDEETPLMKAARNGHIEAVSLLLSKGADATITTSNDMPIAWRKYAMDLAHNANHKQIEDLLAKATNGLCEKNNAKACLISSIYYRLNKYDELKGRNFLEKSCRLNLTEGCASLARQYSLGNGGFNKNKLLSDEFELKACLLGDTQMCMYAGDNAKTTKEKIDLYNKGCGEGDQYNCEKLVNMYEKSGDSGSGSHYARMAFEARRKKCDRGNIVACEGARETLEKGKDKFLANFKISDIYRKAVEKAFAECEANRLSGCMDVLKLSEDIKLQVDNEKTNYAYTMLFDKFVERCDKNDIYACRKLGDIYRADNGQYKNLAKSSDLYEKSISLARQGCKENNGNSCESLAFIYAEGQGVKANLEIATEHMKKACALNNDARCAAMDNLKLMTIVKLLGSK